jgi:hypothetical protein
VNHGALLPVLEWYARYAFKIITHVQRTSIRTFAPKAEAVEDYYVWNHQLMKRLTYATPCHSWFKGGDDHGPANAVYAGSRAHFYESMKEPRYEDLDITYNGSRFGYYGNGYSQAEAASDANNVWYLDELRKEFEQGKEAYEITQILKKDRPLDISVLQPQSEKSKL